MKPKLSAEEMNSILSRCLHPVRSNCIIEADGTLTIQFSHLGDDFTIVGISKDEYRNEQALMELGKSLVAEIEVALSMVNTPQASQHYAGQ